jgi:hypothetical protein
MASRGDARKRVTRFPFSRSERAEAQRKNGVILSPQANLQNLDCRAHIWRGAEILRSSG